MSLAFLLRSWRLRFVVRRVGEGRTFACRSGCPVSSYGQSLANELGVTVKGANVDVFPQYNGVQKLAPGGSWFTYTPGGNGGSSSDRALGAWILDGPARSQVAG